MKILMLNGSPRRNGNTTAALKAVAEGMKKNIAGGEIEIIDVAEKTIAGCIGCNTCKGNGGACIHGDDTNEVVQKMCDADMIIFGSPVYWWGVSAQIKAAIDKMYARVEDLQKPKKIGVVIIGESGIEDLQYSIIRQQFQCICDYLQWEFSCYEAISAGGEGDLAKNDEKLEELKAIWSKLI